jgi:ABC-type sulfate/molybdate transport systems ATPase subunit
VGASLTLRDVRRRRDGRDVLHVPALDVAAGGRLGVLGANGAGKTTLLRLLAGLDRPDAGTVLVDGVETRSGGVALRRRVAYAPQRPALLTMSVQRNVELPLRYRGIGASERPGRARAALETLGIGHLAGRRAHALSGGEAQRVSLARTLATDPAVLLLDEPAAALDPGARAAFLDDLERVLAARDVTVVHVSHRPEEVLRSAGRVAVLVDGRLVQAGPAADVLAHPASVAAARLLGYENVLGVEVRGGAVHFAGNECGAAPPGAADGPAALAVWAAGVRLDRCGGAPALVTAVAAAAGRWDVGLDAGGVRVRAHVPLTVSPPIAGTAVALGFDTPHAALVPI